MIQLDTLQYQKAAATFAAWHRPLIITHARPDGDALGSVLAMRALLRSRGLQPLALLFDPVPPPYEFMTEQDPLGVLGRDATVADLREVDGIVMVDTCAFAQLAPLADWLRATSLPILAVDHHVTRDVPVAVPLLDTGAAAAAMILYDWACTVGWPLDPAVATALFVGIATDTGWFAFGNTDARVLEAAAALIRGGVEPHDLYVRVYQSDRAAKVRLLGAALDTLDLLDGGRVAVMQLSRAAFARCGAQSSDTEGIINEPLRIGSVDVSVLFVEGDDGVIRTSFRSKRHADVAALAAGFGGGGHVNASGARIRGTLAEVRQRVLASVVPA